MSRFKLANDQNQNAFSDRFLRNYTFEFQNLLVLHQDPAIIRIARKTTGLHGSLETPIDIANFVVLKRLLNCCVTFYYASDQQPFQEAEG
jgi:hypothetical protein